MISTISTQHKLANSSLEVFKSKNIHIDSATFLPPVTRKIDTVDNPVHTEDIVTESIFRQMKYERNRLYSFQNKWPLRDITPESLAGAGLFYLQHEDKVQCPFCHIIIFNWTLGDNPLREHMRRKPKCPFLMGSDVGNVPLSHERYQMPQKINASCDPETNYLSHTKFLYKPKHPRMADVKRRLMTYSGWPVNWLSPEQLAECGLYYSGIADVVTCFFCGGSLGNWEPNDDPWNEHAKYFPDCSFLSVAKNSSSLSSKVLSQFEEPKDSHKLNEGAANGASTTSFDITSDVIREAQCIFPEDVVLESVSRKGGNILSLQELCDDILEGKQEQEEASPLTFDDTKQQTGSRLVQMTGSSSSTSQVLLCVICMDKERGIAYQPCGHFVSCPSCASKIHNCPVCRMPIVHKMRIYHT